MKSYDANAAARVWDRVQSTALPPGDAPLILNLIAEAQLDAVCYRQLSKALPPALSASIRQLAQQTQAQGSCLKGIYTMITGETPKLPPQKISADPPGILLRRCYGRQMRALSQYEARQSDPQYGHVFRSLARQSQEHCRKILETLGALGK